MNNAVATMLVWAFIVLPFSALMLAGGTWVMVSTARFMGVMICGQPL